jgi:hypothetical protein
MRRTFRHATTLLSLALMLLSLTLWARSHWVTDAWSVCRYTHLPSSHVQRTHWIASSQGRLFAGQTRSSISNAELQKYRINAATLTDTSQHRSVSPAATVHLFGNTTNSREWSFAGFSYGRINPGNPTLSAWNLALPFWAIVLVTSLLPLRWLVGRRRNRPFDDAVPDDPQTATSAPAPPAPGGSPAILDYHAPSRRRSVFIPGRHLSCSIAAILCWLPVGLTLALVYHLWKHPVTAQAGIPAILICFLAAPLFWFARVTFYPPPRLRQERPHRFLQLSLVALFLSVVLCIEMVLQG